MSILCYHTVDPDFTSRLSLTPAQFDEHCRFLATDRDVVDLDTAIDLINRHGQLPRGTVALTFDDGLEGVYRHVYPTLVRYGLPGTVFMVVDTLTGAHPEVDWIDGTPPGRLRAMTAEQMLEMAGDGIGFGSHSSRHLDLPSLQADACEADLAHGRAELADLLGDDVPYVAYPRGRHDEKVRAAAAAAGHTHAFGLPEGPEPFGPLAIPRVGVYAHNSMPTVRIKSTRPYVRLRTGPVYPLARALVRSARRVAGGSGRDRPDAVPAPPPPNAPPEAAPTGPHVAYVMSRWPKISETFILNEVLEMGRQGVEVSLFPLLRERQSVVHPEAVALTREATFVPFVSPSVVASVLASLRDRPRRLLRVLWDVLRGTWGSPNFFVGALGVFPKAVHMARLMEQRGIDHVHCHFATHPAIAGMIVQRLTGIPFSFVAHGSDLHKDQRMLGEKVAEAAFACTVSEFNREVMHASVAPQHHHRIHVVHCGVDLDRFRPSRPPTGSDPLRVVCVGTLHEVKGQSKLVDACAQVIDRGIAIDCRIVGDGPDRPRLEEQVRRLGVGDHVHLVGALPSDDVVRELDAADVLIAPSVPTASGRREGIPVVLMEAMAMQRAVVASRLSGIPELVEDGRSGILVPPGDVSALADALSDLATAADQRQRLGAAAREVVEGQFNLAVSTAQLRDLVEHARVR